MEAGYIPITGIRTGTGPTYSSIFLLTDLNLNLQEVYFVKQRRFLMSDISNKMPLRGIRCVHYYRKMDEKDDSGGSIYKGFYRVILSKCETEDGEFEPIGQLDLGNHERAIAFCLSRMSGDIDRKMPESRNIPFDPQDTDIMWEFDLREKISCRYIGEEWHSDPEKHVYKSCDSTILVRNSINRGLVRYEGIGHMSVLGIAHIVDTISRDNHLDSEDRADTAMFKFNGRMYVPTMFDQVRPVVFGTMIGTTSRSPVEINHLNYHSNFVDFCKFGTVKKCGRGYYLNGERVHSGVGMEEDEVLEWIAHNYPESERYSMPNGCGSMEYIRRNSENKK
jgi:hypothetical protein